jgi:hypothetical protein
MANSHGNGRFMVRPPGQWKNSQSSTSRMPGTPSNHARKYLPMVDYSIGLTMSQA